MNDSLDKALLPAGMQDGLPPEAQMEADAIQSLMNVFIGWGYQRVKPPLMEFEENLLGGIGQALNEEAFRLLDPASRRMMALRPDQTPQVARIAGSRMSRSPRPLRLAYSGEIVRVRGSQIRSERQFAQVGAEIIGADTLKADVEVALMALDALEAAGINDISIDIGLPTLVAAITKGSDLDGSTETALRLALDRKDTAEIASMEKLIGKKQATAIGGLLEAIGPAKKAIKKLKSVSLSKDAKKMIDDLSHVIDGIWSKRPDVALTIDAIENRGFEYHTGVTFAFFSKSSRGELGRGGRYQTDFGRTVEQATGLTLFMDTILRALPASKNKDIVLLAPQTGHDEAVKLRSEGWITIQQLDDKAKPEAEAKRLGCSHVFSNAKITKIKK
ncbi:MAG: ATP phosphoribosyltransferase regulatory subunit [Rhodospirillaceae bacterium]|nr:ATP phosphoribosyltransferase regulatory subunit [Rhodospirillaceae bacterium]